MSEPKKYDVIIAGAGPAGSTAGYILSRSGFSVLIIDRHSFPRNKLCAGLITDKTVRLLQRVFGETGASLKEKEIINYESSRYEVFFKKKPLVRRDISIPFRFTDRSVYDHFLLNKARNAGTELLEDDGVRSLDMLRSTVTTSRGRKFAAGIIIGADGVNSRVRRSFPVDLFGREDWVENLAVGHEIAPGRASLGKQINAPMIFFGFIDCGYAWIFPNRERLKIGMCALNKGSRKEILAAFRTFLSSIDIHGAQEEKVDSYVLPYGNFLPSPVFRNVVLVGDAAGFADPLLGEGIYFAQRSAELASLSIVNACRGIKGPEKVRESVSHRYLQLLQEHIYPELLYAGKIRHAIFSCFNKFRYMPLKIAMTILGDKPAEAVHGIRSYKWMKKRK